MKLDTKVGGGVGFIYPSRTERAERMRNARTNSYRVAQTTEQDTGQ